jgi:hypothetical protein
MAKSVDDRGRGARLARRDEGAYCWYVAEEQRSQPGKPGCLGREGDRLSHSRALRRGVWRAAFRSRLTPAQLCFELTNALLSSLPRFNLDTMSFGLDTTSFGFALRGR